jgi:hypothetical protein
MMFGPRAKISPSSAIRISTPGMGLPTLPNRGACAGFTAQHGTGLGQAVAFQNQDAEGVEELSNLFGQGSTT